MAAIGFFSSYHKFVDGGKKRGGRHQPVACTINIVTVVNYVARGVIYDCSGIAIL